ncbi:anion transporter [Erwinia sp. OLTSP20]|uniref:SLC13 family permease n=1 Tax=unclassified Erwinia TaxID=2622719 RepID=UPI000C1909AE|nr:MULTISPECIES: SLC13 family permease [unclassified Erwinia]PIJ48678.1 anion transporter [Erwinia sp. OAMSP11]PIJ69302.1 anion transporter [Erwinia sp. OLSSP12]PIJ79136.1 anion transporter [Erwinia sp. OLCASP19]PIJ80662.1 anion transporter [Erwinia sp. OLMTSP26]PIJ82813.1 anion transporter [Erwinia sp. OLMDSP33]
MSALLRTLIDDRLLQILLLIGLITGALADFHSRQLADAVDWHTILTLAGLLLLTKGIESSGYFAFLGQRLIQRFCDQRSLALFMVAASALLSTFLTNDVALFITVPLTLTLRRFTLIPLNRLIIFEALAVNAGSLLTPIGNPQNILLWNKSGQSFLQFIGQMLPLALLLMAALLVLTACSFGKKAIQLQAEQPPLLWQRGLLIQCAVLYLLFIIALEFNLAGFALLIIALFFLWRTPQLLLQLDWSLLVVFILMFIDVFFLTHLPLLAAVFQQLTHWAAGARYLLAIGLSQFISNVPATLLLLNILPASTLLSWAVNIGGFGLLPGSLANLIALRMARDRRIWWQFHLYSMPFLLFACLAGWLLFLLIGVI